MMNLYLTSRMKEIITGITVPFILIVGLGGSELAFRLQQGRLFGVQETVGKTQNSFYYIDEVTGLRLPRPGTRHGRIQINDQGFRGPHLELPKPQGVIRIAFIGTSTTYDADAGAEENTWPSVTTATLGTRFPECDFEYLNAGVPGFHSKHIIERFRAHVVPMEPDLVVVLTNDLNGDGRAQAEDAGVWGKHRYKPSWLAQHSLVWGKIEKNLFILKLQRQSYSVKGKLEMDVEKIQMKYRDNLHRLLRETGAVADQTVVLKIATRFRAGQTRDEQIDAASSRLFYMPYATVPDIVSAIEGYNEVIDDLKGVQGTTVVDPEPALPPDSIHFSDTSHTTVRGSRVLGEYLGGVLAADRDFSELVERISPGCLGNS
jgi:lysophospholipase L1-like esterase